MRNLAFVLAALLLLALPAVAHGQAAAIDRVPPVGEFTGVYVVAISALVVAQTVLIVVLLTQRRRLRIAEETVRHGQADLQASRERICDLGSRLLVAQDAERSRIALELHDDVSQQLAVLSMNLQMLCGFGSGRDDEAETVAREALDHADGIARSLRDLSHRLYPTKVKLLGLVPAINSLQHDVVAGTLKIHCTNHNVPSGLPHSLSLALYRVAQEALHNAITHSQAREVRVHLEGRDGALFLTIADDGVGFDVEGSTGVGLGLISMRERLEPVGGVLRIKSSAASGTSINVIVADVASAALAAG
jgi:signal transduction histidine kinase